MTGRVHLREVVSIALCSLLGWQLASLAARTGFSWELASKSLQPRAGETESLPVEITGAMIMVRAEEARLNGRVRLGTSIAADPLLMQRTFEASYPVRVSERAAVVLARPDDWMVETCAQLRRLPELGLYDCQQD